MKKLIGLIKRNPLESILALVAVELAFLIYLAAVIAESTDPLGRQLIDVIISLPM